MRNIDIYCAYTQWGKTNLFVNKIVNYSEDDFMIIMPNLLLARDDMHSKITKSTKNSKNSKKKQKKLKILNIKQSIMFLEFLEFF